MSIFEQWLLRDVYFVGSRNKSFLLLFWVPWNQYWPTIEVVDDMARKKTGLCCNNSVKLGDQYRDLIYNIYIYDARAGVSNHQPHECLLNRLFRRRSKKTLKLRPTDLCAGNSPVTGEFPAQMASNAENISIWWRHHSHTGGIARWSICYYITNSLNVKFQQNIYAVNITMGFHHQGDVYTP